ncbi:hypothetical protein [Streptomyces sp. NPDC007172]|uniref:hypothetical protein n=1 Tax=Streptomyces sp. NPDC007172 TaxID=3364776 RepID=UPI0036C0958B
MTHILTPYTPRQQWGLRTAGAALPPVALRRMATGESEETARVELTAFEHLIPMATPGQTRGEARVFQALISAYGRHRLTLTGGPFGIRSLTPRPDELVVRIAPSQLDRWIDALANGPEAAGLAGLRWAGDRAGIRLTLPGMRMLLAQISETSWLAALGRLSARRRMVLPQWVPELPEEAEHIAAQDTELAGIAHHLSATLRRIRLVDPLTRSSGHVYLFTSRHHGDLHLIEACDAMPTVLPLWISRSLPLALWPAGQISAQEVTNPATSVLGLIDEIEPAAVSSRSPGGAARALCHLAGLNTTPVLVRAAQHALGVAARVLSDPAHASLHFAGGWAGRCRTSFEGTVHGTDPCLPPGTEEVTDLPEEVLLGIGSDASGRSFATPRSDAVNAGRTELVRLLDWALAAATRSARCPDWTRTAHEHGDAYLQHTQPLPDHDGTLTLAVSTTGVYRVSLDGLGLSDLAEEADAVEWEREAAPSQSAAVLLAEHAAIEAVVSLPFQREHRKQRLVLPNAVSDEPTIRSVIAGADYVLGFFTLASVLGRLHDREASTQGASDGHWRTDRHAGSPRDRPATLTALISDWFALPSPHDGEAANTAAVDSPAYLRHLAAHRAAFDPFAARYLAAADRLSGTRTFEERHVAGFAALRTTDLSALACQEIRPVHEGFLRLVRSIPQDSARLNAWYQTYIEHA